MICLFSDVATCSGDSSEHVIQKCLGGRHENGNIICDTCNHYFGEEIDPGLCSYYSILIDVLRPLMSKKYRHVQRDTVSVEKSIPLARREGGIVELKKHHVEYKSDGSIDAIYIPGRWSEEKRANILAAYKVSEKAKSSCVPLTDLTPCAMSKHHFVFGRDEHRAASKSIMEVIDWQTQAMGIESYARSPQLRLARTYIRHGGFCTYIDRRTPPMYDLEDEFERFFGTNAKFSNRVLFCNDVRSNRCFGLIQIAQTMPLGLCLGESVKDADFSLMYESAIIQGASDSNRCELRNELLISYPHFKDRGFLTRTKDSVEFAYAKMNQSISRQLGRATTMIDLYDDENVLEMLRQFAVDAIQNREASGNLLLRATCEPLIRMRFRHSSISESMWDDLFGFHSIFEFDHAELEKSIKSHKSLGRQQDLILTYYRNVIRLMVSRYGHPQVLTPL